MLLIDGMPNATLCGRAVALMVLSQLSSSSSDTQAAEAALEEVTSTLLSSGDLPEQYVLTPERIQRTMKMPTVAMRENEALRPLAGRTVSESGSEGFVSVNRTDAALGDKLEGGQQGKCVVM